MLTQFRNARVLDAGYYEITDAQTRRTERYPWVDLLQRRDDLAGLDAPARDSTGPQRFSVKVERDDRGEQVGPAAFEGVPFGTLVEGWFEISDQTKVIKGTDRSVDQTKLAIVSWRPMSDPGHNGALTDDELEHAATHA